MKVQRVPQKRILALIPLIILAAPLLAVVLTSVVQAAPSTQNPTSVYGMTLAPQDIELCVGQGELFIVTVPLNETRQMRDGTLRDFQVYYSGNWVEADVRDDNVGDISPVELRTSVVPGGQDMLAPIGQHPAFGIYAHVAFNSPQQLWFYFTAKKTGTTTIEFKHTNGVLGYPRAASLTAQVEVGDCWEAYATGLWTANAANNWTQKDICSLERPFVLEGNGAAVAGLGTADFTSKAFFFWPSSNPFAVAGLTALQDGSYVYVGGTVLTAPNMTVECIRLGSGSYQQFLFENRTPKEGNFVLAGSYYEYCQGYLVGSGPEVIEVAFRALGAGQACQESLP